MFMDACKFYVWFIGFKMKLVSMIALMFGCLDLHRYMNDIFYWWMYTLHFCPFVLFNYSVEIRDMWLNARCWLEAWHGDWCIREASWGSWRGLQVASTCSLLVTMVLTSFVPMSYWKYHMMFGNVWLISKGRCITFVRHTYHILILIWFRYFHLIYRFPFYKTGLRVADFLGSPGQVSTESPKGEVELQRWGRLCQQNVYKVNRCNTNKQKTYGNNSNKLVGVLICVEDVDS